MSSSKNILQKFRSVSTNRLSRLKKNTLLSSNKFLYFGENPEKDLKLFRSRTPLEYDLQRKQNQTPFMNPKSSEKKKIPQTTESTNRFHPSFKIKRRKISSEKIVEEKSDFYRRRLTGEKSIVGFDNNRIDLFIEHLTTVPIAERKNNETFLKRHCPFLRPSPVSKVEFKTIPRDKSTETAHNKEKQIIVPNPKELILYCDPLTIDDTESLSPPFKPRYL